MLFMVISDPYFGSNKDIAPKRNEFRTWLNELTLRNKVKQSFHKMGKGMVVLFDMESNDELHSILVQWLDIVNIPVKFEIIPLVTP